MSGLHQQDEIGQTNLWIITNKNEKAYFYKIFHQGYLFLAETSSLIVKALTSPQGLHEKGVWCGGRRHSRLPPHHLSLLSNAAVKSVSTAFASCEQSHSAEALFLLEETGAQG